MATPRHLSRAPIAEATVDVRIEGRALQAAILEPLANELTSSVEGRLATQAQNLGVQGYFLRSTARDRIVQLRVDGFTFNRLPQYVNAEEMLDEAIPLLMRYLDVAKPDVASRLAMRYINRLALPFDAGNDFNRFLTAAPPVPAELPQMVSEFRTRVVLFYREMEPVIVGQRLTTLLDKPSEVLLDVDAIKNGRFDLQEVSLRAHFGELRQRKNDVFFAHLTEEAVNLYE
jgi:uncharacterized protein (TIGR04255 family)